MTVRVCHHSPMSTVAAPEAAARPVRRVDTVGAAPVTRTRVPLGRRARMADAASARAIARILPALGKERVEVAAFQSSI